MSSLIIRKAEPADVPTILELINALAAHEKAQKQVIATEASIRAALFGDVGSTRALIAQLQGEIVGLAVYFLNFSTWQGQHGLYLEDLYVRESARGQGVGKAFFQHLAQIAVTQGLSRFEWSVLNWNTHAIKFYESFGAQPQREWIRYRLTGDALDACAEGTPLSDETT